MKQRKIQMPTFTMKSGSKPGSRALWAFTITIVVHHDCARS